MKILRFVFLLLFISVAASAQTQDLGQNVFFNDEGAINVCVDASLAVRKLDSPYVMFMVFMVANGNDSISAHRDDVVMIYKGQEYKMPSLEEWRKNYKAGQNDIDLYLRLGKESLAMSQMKYYKFPSGYDFFPFLGEASMSTDELSISGQIGARSKFYFKNPGFQKGDELIIKVKDHKNPGLVGAAGVILK